MIRKKWDGELEQLLKQDPIAMGMLGKQTVCDQVYRPLKYILTAEEADKKIFYNLLTHEMIAVKLNELKLQETRNYLIENWYMVQEDHNDQQLVDECRAVLTLMNSWPKKIHLFYIFTTLDCNARCFYCYEKRKPGFNMTIETASKAIEYMQEQVDGALIKIVWFGGEPLFNYSIIDFMAEGLREKGLQFESDMVSNGLLFDRLLIEKARYSWNLKTVQITLDGTRQVYSRVKAYVTDVTDPFEKVIQNIKQLLMMEIKVLVRLNIGFHNYNDIRELVDFLCEEFRGEKNLNVYTSPLLELKDYNKDKKEYIYELQDELNNKLERAFFKKRKKFFETFANSSCMASGQEAVTILPDGKIGICPNVVSDVLLGDIYTKEFNVKVREDFRRRFYREDKCSSCPLYPNCYIVSGCPNRIGGEGCDPVKVKREIGKIREKMKIRCRISTFGDEPVARH